MNKIIQLSLASALMTTTSFSITSITHTLETGIEIANGTQVILPENHVLTNSGTNNGLSGGTYDASRSTAIDVLVGGRLVADASDQQQREPSGTGGTIGTDGENDNNGLTVRHHEANWVESDTASKIYGIACERGFISDSINFAKDTYLQEMYDTSKLDRIYFDNNDPQTIGEGSKILLSTTTQGNLGDGEKVLSTSANNITSSNLVEPGAAFTIHALSNKNAIISANLSNNGDDFSGKFSAGYTPSNSLQILPAESKTLTFTGDNRAFSGMITIGDSDNCGTIVFGDEESDKDSTNALGNYTSMTVNNNSTVSLAGSDKVTINKEWKLYGTAKLQANGRIALTGEGNITFGK